MLIKLIHWLLNSKMGILLKERILRLEKDQRRGQKIFLMINLKKEEENLSSPVEIPPQWQEQVAALRSDFHKKFSRFVLWGLYNRRHSHRYIQRACYFTAKRLSIPTVWLEDTPESNAFLLPGDLVTVRGNHIVDGAWHSSHIKPLPDVCYYLWDDYRHDFISQLKKEQYLSWQEYKLSRIPAEHRPDMIRISSAEGLYYNPKLRLLVQHNATDLLPWEFLAPVFNPHQKQVNYVGSLWGENQEIVGHFLRYLRSVGLKFNLIQMTTLAKQIELIRQSRLAPSISGAHAAENYPPCRMYKNISYGQLGYANVPIHQEIYKDCHPPVGSIEEMSDYVLGMSKSDYTEMVHEQQKVTQNHTFLQYLANLFKYF